MNPIDSAVQQANNQEDLNDAPTETEVENKPAPKKKAASKSKDKAVSVKKVPTKVVAKVPEKKAAAKPAAKVAKIPAEVKNDVTRPQKGTASGKVWDLADAAAKTKAGAIRKTILERAATAGVNAATAATQFARWRQFNGITGAAK